jgi:predicted esterase
MACSPQPRRMSQLFLAPTRMDGETRRRDCGGVCVYWQPPPPPAATRGLVFLAHGMCHGAYDFFERSAVPDGVGLPEELRLVDALRTAGYACAAISSIDRVRKAWSSNDEQRVVAALAELRASEAALGAVPLFGFGISNGGAFVLKLALSQAQPLFTGVAVQIMALPPPVLQHLLAAGSPPRRVAFIHMPQRDTRTAALVAANQKLLGQAGVQCEVFSCAPLAVTDSFFSERISVLTRSDSAAIARALVGAGIVDARTRLLTTDPRGSDWRACVAPLGGAALGADSLVADESPLSEELNVAWAAHELTAEHAEDVLRFLHAS